MKRLLMSRKDLNNMSLNIIIKGKTPSWRKYQPILGHFRSKHKGDSRIVESGMRVEDQFDKSEMERIVAACRATEKMGVDFENEKPEDVSIEDTNGRKFRSV